MERSARIRHIPVAPASHPCAYAPYPVGGWGVVRWVTSGVDLPPCGREYNRDVAARTMNPVHDGTCSVAACAEIIGAKWTALLVHDLSEGARRFSELEHSCRGISPRTLSERLRWLEAEGLIVRQSYPESPPRVEYALTEKGEGLLPIIGEMRRFGHDFLACG